MKYICSVCGYMSLKPLGKCPNCGEWDTFVEEGKKEKGGELKVIKLKDVKVKENLRINTGMEGVNRVLGGGLVEGSVVLLGGSPGVGKSTLFLQIANNLHTYGYKVLLVSAEESVYQVKQRAKRLDIDLNVEITEETNIDYILNGAEDYDVIFVDSVQAVYTQDLNSPPGSISQVRFCADKLFKFAKTTSTTVLLSGHITKSGVIAGPKTLEHLVDVVLYLEGEKGNMLKVLRAEKNRFGPTDEMAFFIMGNRGLVPIEDPSMYFYTPYDIPKIGVAYTITLKGSIPMALEVQALVHNTFYPVPIRHSVGYDPKRLAIVLALLEKMLNYKFAKRDVYINIGGGIKTDDSFIDMAVCSAIISSLRNIPLDNAGIFIGEISLTGEFKSPINLEIRESEGKRLGFKRLYSPKSGKTLDWFEVKNLKDLNSIISP